MDRNCDIRLDPDVYGSDMVESEAQNQVSLSDLYDLPVFAEDTEQRARELHAEGKKVLEQVRQGLFESDRQDGEEILQRIRSRMFQNMSGLSAQRVQASGFAGQQEKGKRADWMPQFALQQSLMPGLAGKTEGLQGNGILLGITMIGIICIISGRRKSRRRGRRSIHMIGGCRK